MCSFPQISFPLLTSSFGVFWKLHTNIEQYMSNLFNMDHLMKRNILWQSQDCNLETLRREFRRPIWTVEQKNPHLAVKESWPEHVKQAYREDEAELALKLMIKNFRQFEHLASEQGIRDVYYESLLNDWNFGFICHHTVPFARMIRGKLILHLTLSTHSDILRLSRNCEISTFSLPFK